MNKYDEKIKSIKETEKQLLQLVKTKIEEKDGAFTENIVSVVKILNYDSTMVKKNEAVLSAQKLIEELTNKIKNAKSVEEIIEIRKKLNYYINKIKKELKERNIDSSQYNKYVLNANNLRKGISEYIRYLKRENKINEIEYLNNKSELTEEEVNNLKRLVRNEVSYGKKNLAKYNNLADSKPKLVQEENHETDFMIKLEEKKQENKYIAPSKHCSYIRGINDEKSPNMINNNAVGKYFIDSERNSYRGKDKKETSSNNNSINIQSNGNFYYQTYENDHDFLSAKVDMFTEKYDVIILEGYTESKVKNIRIFARNLPTLLRNKGQIKYMIRDWAMFNDRKPELNGFAEYTRNENSIINSFKKALAGSKLVDQETFYTQEHEKCISWIMEFCKNNNLKLSYPTLKV